MTNRLHVMTFIVVLVLAALAQGQSFRVLYNFTGGTDGDDPWAGLMAADGNLYGTTYEGGFYDYGVVFRVSTNGQETVIHRFTGGDGAYPFAPLMRCSEGKFYGTTSEGGTYGVGAVFEMNSAGEEHVLHSFSYGTSDGCIPLSGLVEYEGDLYGLTYNCGAYNKGAIFKLTKTGKETLLHSFAGGSLDGAFPIYTSLAVDERDGTFYGVTEAGGPWDKGILYKMTREGKVKVLYNFAGGKSDGCSPMGTPVLDKKGNIYGTASGCGPFGYGTMWKVTPKGKETILHSFPDRTGDGKYPRSGVSFDSKGNIYGVTPFGGKKEDDCGIVFELNRNNKYTVLHRFDWTDGGVPDGQILVYNGRLYGTTALGYRFGNVWEYVP